MHLDEKVAFVRTAVISNLVAFNGQVLNSYNIESIAKDLVDCILHIVKEEEKHE